MRNLIILVSFVSLSCASSTEDFYGRWVGISTSTESIYGHILLDKNTISWGGNKESPPCHAKYKVAYSGLASNYIWPKSETLEARKESQVLKMELIKESLVCSKKYGNYPMFDQIKYLSIWVDKNNFNVGSLIEFSNENAFFGDGTIMKE